MQEQPIVRTGEWAIAARGGDLHVGNPSLVPADPLATPDSPSAALAASEPVQRTVPRWWWWTLVFGGWTLFGVFSANQSYLYVLSTTGRVEVSWRELYLLSLSSMWMWALLTPCIVWLARRLRVERPHVTRALVAHLLLAIALHTMDVWVDDLKFPLITSYPPRPFLAQYLYQFDINVFSYLMIVAATHAVDYYGLYRGRRLREERLQAQLMSARLEVLKMQLQPHFLFNTLNAISELVHEDSDAADRMITRLGDLLRLSLDNAGAQEVTLKQELEFLRAYVEIEKTRFQDRLSVRLDIEPAALDALVPNLVLQPLVENAIRHGIARSAEPGQVEILARRDDGLLELEIRDSGSGVRGDWPPREGVGLRNTRVRLEQLYGPAHRFELSSGATGGVVVNLSLPYRVEAGIPGGASSVPDGAGPPSRARQPT